jgi:hypothetical protein
MDSLDPGKEFARAAIAAIVALLVGLWLKATGAGKWLTAAASGAVGALAAAAIV